MQKYLLSLAVVCSLLLISGCTEDNKSDPTGYSTAEVEGNWTAIQDARLNMFIDNSTWNYMTIATDSIYELRQSYQIVGEKTIQPNNLTAKKLDLIYIGNFRTYTTQSAIDAVNQLKECSFDNWEVNVTKDTSDCDSGIPAGTQMKNIYYFDGTVLSNGDFSQLDEDLYPEALDTSYTYQKQ